MTADSGPPSTDASNPGSSPAGYKAVVFTTNADDHALTGTDDSAVAFMNADNGQAAASDDLAAFVRGLSKAVKGVPYGNKVLLPALVQTFNAYNSAGRLDGLRGGLSSVLRNHVYDNSQNGYIRYLQSNVKHASDADIPTQGRVPPRRQKTIPSPPTTSDRPTSAARPRAA